MLEELEIYKSIVSKSRVLAFVWRVAPGVWPVEFVSDNVEDVLGYTADDFMSGRVSSPTMSQDLKQKSPPISRRAGPSGLRNTA